MVAEEVFILVIPHSKPWITEADQKAVIDVLDSRMIAQGDQVRLFEETCAQYLGVPDGVAVGSGTAALTVALLALELKKKKEVVLPTYVCRNVAEAVLTAGYSPVLCDVGEHWTMTAEKVAQVLTRKTGAMILVHLFGIPVDVEEFKRFDLPIIDNACQAFGATLKGQRVGSLGTVGVFSFHATKNLTTGEGGLVVSKDRLLLHKMRKLRDGGDLPALRVFSPMTDLQATLGLSQLLRYPSFLKQRRFIAELYFEALSDCPVILPDAVRRESIFFRFPIRVSGNFAAVRQRFAERGVHVRQGVDTLLHHFMCHPSKKFANAERLFRETVSLPIYPGLMEEEQKKIIHVCWETWGTK
jgi:UDP-4-amino-4-deoxy-L-arabinose-oxoglutarate aminotransferase